MGEMTESILIEEAVHSARQRPVSAWFSCFDSGHVFVHCGMTFSGERGPGIGMWLPQTALHCQFQTTCTARNTKTIDINTPIEQNTGHISICCKVNSIRPQTTQYC